MLRDYIAAKSVLITFDDKPRKPQQPFLLRLATCWFLTLKTNVVFKMEQSPFSRIKNISPWLDM